MEDDQMAKQMRHQRQLTQASLDGQEKERREIGKELHDNIGQQLTTIKLFLDLAKSTADDNTNEMVSMALKGVSDMINEVRAMSRSLIPSTLNDLGLSESINELIESIVRTQLMKIEFEDNDFEEESLQENQKLTLFRIIQEQLNNIVKHSGAKNVWIELSNEEKKLMLKIRDDGAGFDLKKVRKGLGFMNIKNRAELFQGQAEIISKPGEGCLLKVSMPFKLSGITVS
jgi:signal transduction histidine kinase